MPPCVVVAERNLNIYIVILDSKCKRGFFSYLRDIAVLYDIHVAYIRRRGVVPFLGTGVPKNKFGNTFSCFVVPSCFLVCSASADLRNGDGASGGAVEGVVCVLCSLVYIKIIKECFYSISSNI